MNNDDQLALFESVINFSDDAIITKTIDGIITSWNKAAEVLFGYTHDEIIGKHISLIIPKDRINEELEIIEKIKAGKYVKHYETERMRKDGSVFYISLTVSPLKDKNGVITGASKIARDITERKLNQEKLLESEQFIKTITDCLPAMVSYWTTDLNCQFANKAFLQWFGKSSEEMLGISRHELMGMDSEDFNKFDNHIQGVLQGEAQRFENVVLKDNGSKVYFYIHYLPKIENDVIKGYYSFIYDITELKFAELEIKKKTEQIGNLLEGITDGFIALDQDMCYTYANKRIAEMLGRTTESMIGKNIWELFPDAIGSATYEAVQLAFKEGKYVCNEDYYAPLNLWQENRIYSTGNGISMFIRDITKQKHEEEHLRLLESVITNTTDVVMITEAEPFDEPGPRIMYVNEAFTKMTGYSSEEVIGKSPRILQGAKSDKQELKRLSEAMRKWQPYEITIINYKKNGEEFWINFSICPVANEKGWYTHWISIERDVTQRKNEELQKALLSEISLIFNKNIVLLETLHQVLKKLGDFGNFSISEVWLIGAAKKRITLFAKNSQTDGTDVFYNLSAEIKSFAKGEGLPGTTWETQQTQYWDHIDEKETFVRRSAAKDAGLKSAYGLPLRYNSEMIGVLVLGLNTNEKPGSTFHKLLENISWHLGTEIKRKQLEQELNQIFNFAPDIICIAGFDGYFKKVNPAMCTLLEYTVQELLTTPLVNFIHTDDQESSAAELANQSAGNTTFYFENRCVTKSGKIKWFAWTSTPVAEEKLVFSVAKDITDKKELEALHNKATNLARIGGFDFDLVKKTGNWSAVMKEIHEVDDDFEVGFENGLIFYEGETRELILQKMAELMETGIPFDIEVEIVTARKNSKWVRIICEAEFLGDKIVRIYGSCQDIDTRRKTEFAGKKALEERNTILESIDDAFFAVDKNWVVTYWNKMAELVLYRRKDEVLGRNLWEVYSDSIESESSRQYHTAMDTGHATHFEDYYPALHKWYEISAYPSDSGLSVYFKDVTERKTTEIQLNELNDSLSKQTKELKISNAELEQFAYVASHDLQEPLRMVTSFLTQLENKYGGIIDDKGKKYIYFAVDGAKRMRQIILDLLEFSRVGRTEDNIEEVNLNKLINDVLILFRKQIEETNAVITVAHLPTLQTYKSPMRQIFQNLIGNSLKYQQQGSIPVIEVSYEETEQHWEFSVKDNGIGIDAEYFDKIFIIFQRLHNKDQYSGTGMGLAVTKKIVESMGGNIWVASEEGKGSTFHFTIVR